MKTRSKALYFLAGILILFFSFFLSTSIGSVKIQILKLLRGNLSPEERAIIYDLRVPRAITGILIGGALALSGVAVQSLFRNPLAEPYLIGISGGAAFGASLFTLILSRFLKVGSFLYGLPVVSFLFSLLAVFIVYNIARVGQSVPRERLLLSGIAVTFLFSSLTAFSLYIFPEKRFEMFFWLLGGLSKSSWEYLRFSSPLIFFSGFLVFLFSKELDALLLTEEEALSIGVDVEKTKKIVLSLVTLLTAVSVSIGGIIGFVGLMIPHIARNLIGEKHKLLVPFSFLVGGSFLVLTDILARMILSPAEIPIGIITSFLGVPFFLYLLNRK